MIELRDILMTVLTSLVTGGLVAFTLQKLLARLIDHSFRRREIALAAVAGGSADAHTALFDKQLPVYAEVMELVYRSRNATRDCADAATRTHAKASEFHQCKVYLTENLYKYQLFFAEPTFRRLHLVKTELQEFGILLDEVTRSRSVEDSPVDPQVQSIAAQQLRERYLRIDELYEYLRAELREFISSKTTLRQNA